MLQSPQITPLVLHQLGSESSSRKLTELLGSFFFIRILPLTQGSPSKHLLCRTPFATSMFGNKSCTESLPQWKDEGCDLPGGKQNPATVTHGDHDTEEKRWCSIPAPAANRQVLPGRLHKNKGMASTKDHFPLLLSVSSTTLGANSCILASRKNVCVEDLPGFADKRGIPGESQFPWMPRVTCLALTQVSILPLLTEAVTTRWTWAGHSLLSLLCA